MKKAADQVNHLRLSVVRLARIHFWFVGLFAAQITVYDAWDLVTPDVVLKRWIMAALLLVTTVVVWYLARGQTGGLALYKRLVFGLVVVDIAAASFNVYTQRGMAARAVMLYSVPILVSAVLRSRSALFATAVLCIAAYVLTAVSYFVLNFNEGYKIELYGEVGFYSVLFLILASLIWSLTRPKK